MSSPFRFKQFAVDQSGAAMKVGTDGVLLGAWCGVENAQDILDIGTGTGVIALMMAQRNSVARVDAIDIDSGAVECAAANFAASPWAARLKVECKAAQSLDGTSYDLIASNPPYFTDSLLCPDPKRTVARHATELTFAELDSAVCRVLNPHAGRFALVLPTEQMEAYLAKSALNVVRRCDVTSTPTGAVKRVMVELAVRGCGTVETERLSIYTDTLREYSAEYRELTKEFYLKF